MTGQMHDIVIWKGEHYHLVNIDGDRLPTPKDFGISREEIVPPCTACWRGYHNTYQLDEQQFVLKQMLVHTKTDIEHKINTVYPSKSDRLFKYAYENLDYVINFTGAIEIAQDLIREQYVHAGLQNPKAFRTVIKIQLEDGKIIRTEDLSEIYRNLRENS